MWAFENLGQEAKIKLFKAYHSGNMAEAYKILDTHLVRSACSTCPKNDADTKAWMEWYLAQPGNEYLRNEKTR